ncbi:MAG: serine protease [Fulvimarina sp.]|nr:serine protease [Fulvimarina sp.]
MPDLSIAERLIYCSVKLTSFAKGVPIGTGTGFFMDFAETGDSRIPTIVTNKHVVEGSDEVSAYFHFSENNRPSGMICECRMQLTQNSNVDHPDDNIDLCAIPIGGLLNHYLHSDSPIFYLSVDASIIPSDEDWNYFDAIEEVMMIGCPNGLYDYFNNLPIVRRGCTASSMSKRYNGKEEFMVDMACFPGSSGSPVFIYDRTGYLDRRNGIYALGKARLNLVGVLYSGPQISNDGQIILARPTKIVVSSMMHLGNVIRSSALHGIDAAVRDIISSGSASTSLTGPAITASVLSRR